MGAKQKGVPVSVGVPWHFKSCQSFCIPPNWLCHKPCVVSWAGAGCGARLKPAVFAEALAAYYGIKRLPLASPTAQPRCRSFSQSQQLLPLLFSDPQWGAASSVQELFSKELEFSSSWGASGTFLMLPHTNCFLFTPDRPASKSLCPLQRGVIGK